MKTKMTQKEFIKYTERMNKNIVSLLKGNEEELAFKDRKELANLNELDLLEIIEFLQLDRKQWINQYSTAHNDYVDLQQENQELKLELSGYRQAILNNKEMLGLKEQNEKLKSQLKGTTHCFDEEEHNKLKEEITNLSKDVDMWNAKYNDMFDENRMLKKQLEERPKEYVFVGNAQNKTRDFINQITKDNKEFKNQQKKFIKWLEDYINLFDKKDIYEEGSCDTIEEILQKYKNIIGDDK